MPAGTRTGGLGLHDIARLALRYSVPIEDAVLIAVNLCGISSDQNRRRAPVSVRLVREPGVAWMVIVPLDAHASPFVLRGEDLLLGSDLVGHVRRTDADEAVGGYFRDGGHAARLNPNARSRCTGCAFCPNTLEAAADPHPDGGAVPAFVAARMDPECRPPTRPRRSRTGHSRIPYRTRRPDRHRDHCPHRCPDDRYGRRVAYRRAVRGNRFRQQRRLPRPCADPRFEVPQRLPDHLLPFGGVARVGYLPWPRLLGLSKHCRAVR
jgi:hypothetical protein